MSPAGAFAIRESKLLLVEGKDEVNFFTAALQKHFQTSDLQVIEYGGVAKLPSFLRTLKADPKFASVTGIGVIRDADVTPAGATVAAGTSAFASVSGALTAAKVNLACPAGHGSFAVGTPSVGVFIMPDGISDGMLETLCINSISGEAEFVCLTQFFACCQNHGVVPKNMHKARAHAWLASRAEPDKRVGEAALAGYWPFGNSAFAPLWSFIQAIP